MARLIAETVNPKIFTDYEDDVYLALLESIVSQQISVKAADAIFARLCGLFPDDYPKPDALLARSFDELRGAGLSGQKVKYVQSVADFSLTNRLDRPFFDPMTDEEIVQYLLPIKGVGRWTVEMLLMFVLDRPERLRSWAVGLMDFFGRAAYQSAAPNTADALTELSPETAGERFGDATIPGVWCASFAAQAGKGTATSMYPPLVVPNRILYALAGLNDGIVPAASAVWGECLGTLDADHARLVGLALTPSETFESCAFYLSLCDRLAVRGF